MYNDKTYLQKNPTWHIEDSAWKAKQIKRAIDANNITFKTCVEIGCGAGVILQELSKPYTESKFMGYDISSDVTRFWENRSGENVTYFNEDYLANDESCDLLLCIDVFEHIEDYFSFLKKLSGKASDFIFHIPLDLSVLNLVRRNKLACLREEIGHLHYFSKQVALDVLKDSGYRVLWSDYTNRASELKNNGEKLPNKLTNSLRKAGFAIAPDLTTKMLGGASLLVYAQSLSDK